MDFGGHWVLIFLGIMVFSIVVGCWSTAYYYAVPSSTYAFPGLCSYLGGLLLSSSHTNRLLPWLGCCIQLVGCWVVLVLQ
jgi:hypothetical protein